MDGTKCTEQRTCEHTFIAWGEDQICGPYKTAGIFINFYFLVLTSSLKREDKPYKANAIKYSLNLFCTPASLTVKRYQSFFVNNQLEAQFLFLYLFIPLLYMMFRTTKCSSSGKSVVSVRQLVYVNLCRWPCGVQKKTCASSWLFTKIVIRSTVNKI